MRSHAGILLAWGLLCSIILLGCGVGDDASVRRIAVRCECDCLFCGVPTSDAGVTCDEESRRRVPFIVCPEEDADAEKVEKACRESCERVGQACSVRVDERLEYECKETVTGGD